MPASLPVYGRHWNDLLGSITAGTPAGAPSLVAFIDSIKAPKWGVGDGIQIAYQNTHSWDGGPMSPHVHFSVQPGVAGGNVKFQLAYAYCDNTGLWLADEIVSTLEVAVVPDTTRLKMYRRRFSDITVANWEPSTEWQCYLTRVAASDSAFGGDVFVHWFDAHEPRTTLGTETAVVLTP